VEIEKVGNVKVDRVHSNGILSTGLDI